MAEDEALVSWRSGAVFSGDDLPIGATDTESERAHEHTAGARIRLGEIV